MNKPTGKDLKKIAFIVATKDRQKELRRMLQSLYAQSEYPTQVLIVDASSESFEGVAGEFSMLNIRYIRHPEPSASAQRNAGVKAVGKNIDLIGFLDDDIVFEPGALRAMLDFWEQAPEDVGGCAFNLMNPSMTEAGALKGLPIVRWLGLYDTKKNCVMPSGWQTRVRTVKETSWVEWLPTTACVWRKEVLKSVSFDEFFDGYSYLEDLDFSLSVNKQYRLAIIADGKFYHYPSQLGRQSVYSFGKVEVRNRLYIVRKHGLSLMRCFMGITVRFLMTLSSAVRTRKIGHIQRAIGNCSGILDSLFSK